MSPGTIAAVLAVVDNVVERGRVPCNLAFSVLLSGRNISGPSFVDISFRHAASSSLIKCDVAPLSLLANITFCLGRSVDVCKAAVVG